MSTSGVGSASTSTNFFSGIDSSTSSAPTQSYTKAPPLADVRAGDASIARGHGGTSVREIQTALNRQGASLKVDGLFGPKTEAAVRVFQKQSDLSTSGRVQTETLDRLEHRAGRTAPAGQIAGQTAGQPADLTAVFDRVARNAGQRNQMMEGRISIAGNTYQFRSGGGGNGNLPPGRYTVTPHLWSRNDASMNVGGVGYSFALSDIRDPRVGTTRTLLRIHPDGGAPGTIGCIGIVGDATTQRRFREDMRIELNRNGGRFMLNVR